MIAKGDRVDHELMACCLVRWGFLARWSHGHWGAWLSDATVKLDVQASVQWEGWEGQEGRERGRSGKGTHRHRGPG